MAITYILEQVNRKFIHSKVNNLNNFEVNNDYNVHENTYKI